MGLQENATVLTSTTLSGKNMTVTYTVRVFGEKNGAMLTKSKVVKKE
jgi:hypothetical protein